jgi:hypothetical protein
VAGCLWSLTLFSCVTSVGVWMSLQLLKCWMIVQDVFGMTCVDGACIGLCRQTHQQLVLELYPQ